MAITVTTPDGDAAWDAQWVAVTSSFGRPLEPPTDEQRASTQAVMAPDLAISVLDDSETIGGCVAADIELAMPGGAQVAATALSGVGIMPTKLGRGGFRAMMDEHLRRSATRGAMASTLLASEAPLYGRFGYGVATSVAAYEVDLSRADLADAGRRSGSIELLGDREAARPVLSELYRRIATVQPGITSRSEDWWKVVLSDDDSWMGMAKPIVALHRDAAGSPDGYALYRMDSGRSDRWIMSNQLVVGELLAVDVAALASLWHYLVNIPLARRLRWDPAPVDTPIRNLLADRRQLDQVDTHDFLWLRPLDVAGLLRARAYEADGSVSIEVDDGLLPDQRGPWQLTVEGGRATVTETDRADVSLDPGSLGACLLGDARVVALADAGLVAGSEPAVRTLDQLLATARRPFSLSKF